MTKKIGIFVIALACLLVLAACSCEHVWLDATCQVPATCELCGKTEGVKLEHQWHDATCDAPKTCGLCGTTDGSKLEHQWLDATCVAPQTCELCGKTEGESLEHRWCSPCDANCWVCGAENPDSKGHRKLEDLSEVVKFCSWCGYEVIAEHECNWVDATCTSPKWCTLCFVQEGSDLGGHTVTSEEKAGICDVCGKYVEIFESMNSHLQYATEYEISSGGEYLNPITSDGSSSWMWYKDGTQMDWYWNGVFCVDGKFYYSGTTLYDVSEQTRDDLAAAASKYVQFSHYRYFSNEFDGISLEEETNFIKLEVGQAYAAVDANGERYVIIHIGYKDMNPEDTMAIQYDWKS